MDRIEDPSKNWKFSVGDLKERALWDKYMNAYEEAIRETSTTDAPWYVIPADRKWYARSAISQVIDEALQDMKLKFPELPAEEVAELGTIRQQLLDEV